PWGNAGAAAAEPMQNYSKIGDDVGSAGRGDSPGGPAIRRTVPGWPAPDGKPAMSVNAPSRILVVDDDEAGRYVKLRALKGCGYEMLEATTGADALRQIAEAQPDIVLLDVRLPDISGLEVCRRIKTE